MDKKLQKDLNKLQNEINNTEKKESKKEKVKEPIKKKTKKVLTPIITETKISDEQLEKLKQLSTNIQQETITVESDEGSYYKEVVAKLFDDENIELKTEYLNPSENFAGAKLSFLSDYGDIPFLDQFIKKLERKRISLERKGREEIILALNERKKEEEEKQRSSMFNWMGGG